MTGAIRTLALARLRRRASSTILAVGAVTAAVALVAVVSGIGLVAADATLERALSGSGPDRPVVRVSRFSYSASDRAEVQSAAGRLDQLDAYSAPLVRGILFRELIDRSASTFDQVVAVDDPAPLTTLVEGRLPAPCDGRRCEAVLLGETAPNLPPPTRAILSAVRQSGPSWPSPSFWSSDEPTAALDRAGAHAVADLLSGFDGERVTVLATTHDPAPIDSASDRLDLRTARVAGPV